MAEKKPIEIYYTENAIGNAILIRRYLEYNFSKTEVESFFSLLDAFEKAVLRFPKLYPHSNKSKNIRRAVLSKMLSVYYRIRNNKIEVLAVLDNRSDNSEWK